MSILAIIGGKGMLGSDLSIIAKEKGFQIRILDLPEFDITDSPSYANSLADAEIIVNCAAYTAVDKAEVETEAASKINDIAPKKLAEFVKKTSSFLLHIGTDFVFGDLSAGPQKEDDPVHPLCHYGLTKLEGEKNIISSGCSHAIIRVEWTYGRNGNNFVSKISDAARKNKTIKVVDDQTGSPTWTYDASRAILNLAEKRAEGLYHFSSKGYASRFEVAKFIVEHLEIDAEVIPCSSSEFHTPAIRPKNSKFDCSKIDRILDFERPAWQDSLLEFIRNRS